MCIIDLAHSVDASHNCIKIQFSGVTIVWTVQILAGECPKQKRSLTNSCKMIFTYTCNYCILYDIDFNCSLFAFKYRGVYVARKGIKTATHAVIPPAKVQIDQIVKDIYNRGKMIIPTGHAEERLDKREVTLQEVRQVLMKKGSRAARYDDFQTHDDAGKEINRWSYGFVGSTAQGRKLRVCVSVLEQPNRQVLLVTVCDEE